MNGYGYRSVIRYTIYAHTYFVMHIKYKSTDTNMYKCLYRSLNMQEHIVAIFRCTYPDL